MQTWGSVVREYLPKASSRDVDIVLWSMTAFPFNGEDGVRAQLADIAVACAPVQKRGWHRKLLREYARLDAEMMALLRDKT